MIKRFHQLFENNGVHLSHIYKDRHINEVLYEDLSPEDFQEERYYMYDHYTITFK